MARWLFAGWLLLIVTQAVGAAPPKDTLPASSAQARAPAENTAERYPVATIPATDLMDLPPPQPASKKLNWRDAERTLNRLRQARKDSGLAYGELRSFYLQLADPKWSNTTSYEQHLEHLARWRAEIPDSSAALVVAANANIQSAWQARGGGTADKVTGKGWELFATRLIEARRLLERAIQLGAKDGEAYRALINVALGQNAPKEQVYNWVEAGRKIDPTYFPIYESMAIYLLPRWQGEAGEVERFASDLTQKLPGDDGLEAMARVALTVHGYGEQTMHGDALLHGQFDRDLLVRAAETLCRRHPEFPRFAHFAALCAMSAQDHQAARRIRPLLTRFHQDHKVWLWEQSYNHFWSWSGTTESPSSESNRVWATQAGCSGIAFGPDQRHVWCAQQFGRTGVNYVNVRTGELEWALPHPGGAINALAVDNDRRWIVVATGRGALVGWRLYDLRAGTEPISHATAEKCDVLAIHPKLPQIYWAESKTLRSWDFTENKAGPVIELPAAAVRIMFSPDGTVLAIDMDRIAVYEAATGNLKFELPYAKAQPQPAIDCRRLLGIDGEGRAIAHAVTIGQQPNKAPVVRFAPDGATWETLIANTQSAESFLSPDHRLLAVARLPDLGPSPIDVWDVASAQRIKRFDGHWNRVGPMAFSPDGRKLASVGAQADVIKIWSLDDAVELNVPTARSSNQ